MGHIPQAHVTLQDAKIDACVDWFINRLNTLNPDYSPGWRDSLPDFNAFPRKELEASKNELLQHVRRLLPGFFDCNAPLLDNDKFTRKLSGRWRAGVVKKRRSSVDSEDEDNSEGDCVPKSLLDVLMDKQYRERSEHALPSISDDAQTMFVESCRQLKNFVENQQDAASFACGGSIPVATVGAAEPEGRQICTLVNVFWSTRDNSMARKLALPLNEAVQESSQEVLRQLVGDGAPASFGRGEQDVIDPEYRNAVKISPEQFAANFHPVDHGIIERIEQVLLPRVSSEDMLYRRKFHAELYKLNVGQEHASSIAAS